MQIHENRNDSMLTLELEGRLDTTTAPQLEQKVNQSLVGIDQLVVDLGTLEYMSSAGLRVMLLMQKKMNKQGKMTVKNVNETIMEVFEITGFNDILTIE